MGIIHPMLLHPRMVEEINAERLQRGAGPSRRAPVQQQRVPATTSRELPRARWAQRGQGPPRGQVARRGQGAQRGQGVPRGQVVPRGQGASRVLVAPRAPADHPQQRDQAPSATEQETPQGPANRPEEVKGKQKAPRRPRVFKTRLNYLQMSEKQCQKRLRLSRETVTELCAMMQDDLRPMGFGGHSMPVALKLTATLSFYASGSFQGSTGELCGISQAAAHRCIKEVTNALFKRAGEFIRYRTNPESQAERSMGFCAIAGFPRVQGVIDCTHVAIRAPSEQPAAFINKEGYYSISVQLVCDHRMRILQVCARFSGSSDDAYILQNSQVPDLFQQQPQIEGWILGDRSYPLQTWLMTPVKSPRTKAERQYNFSHSSTWATIQQTIGLLKMRFRCLDRSRGALKYDPTKVSQIVVVCCALHNLAQQRGEVLHTEDMEETHCSSDEEGAETSSDEEQDEDKADREGERHHPEVKALKVRQNLILSRFQDPAPL